jgi:hypothetical protein
MSSQKNRARRPYLKITTQGTVGAVVLFVVVVVVVFVVEVTLG